MKRNILLCLVALLGWGIWTSYHIDNLLERADGGEKVPDKVLNGLQDAPGRFSEATVISGLFGLADLVRNSGQRSLRAAESATSGWGGKTVSQTYRLEGFNEIECSGVAQIYFTQGDRYSVKATADEKLLKYLKMKVSDGVLVVETKINRGVNNAKIRVDVTAPHLKGVEISGVSGFHAANIVADDFEVELSGVSVCEFSTIKCRTFSGELSGVGKISGRVAARKAELDVSGTCKGTLDIAADVLSLEQSGAAKMEVNFKGRLAKVENSGAGYLNLRVNSDLLEVENSGVSRIKLSGVAARTKISRSGMSKIDTDALKKR